MTWVRVGAGPGIWVGSVVWDEAYIQTFNPKDGWPLVGGTGVYHFVDELLVIGTVTGIVVLAIVRQLQTPPQTGTTLPFRRVELRCRLLHRRRRPPRRSRHDLRQGRPDTRRRPLQRVHRFPRPSFVAGGDFGSAKPAPRTPTQRTAVGVDSLLREPSLPERRAMVRRDRAEIPRVRLASPAKTLFQNGWAE